MKLDQYVVFCIEYRCNNNCTICMLKSLRAKLRPVSLRNFKKLILPYSNPFKDKKGIIFSGGEVTLNRSLPRYIEYAKMAGFSKIMIQTNGRRLSDLRTTKYLVKSGINEFFVSIHGADSAVHSAITRKTDSFKQTHIGLKNLDTLNVRVITNTVINALNYRVLPRLSEYFSKFENVKESHFWDFLATDIKEQNKLTIPYDQSIPFLRKAVKILLKARKGVVIKYFPECLLLNMEKYLDNSQPQIVVGIEDFFWNKLKKCGFKKCVQCQYTKCEGLPLAHANESA